MIETFEPVDDLKAIRKTLGGSPTAFGTIVRRYQREVRQVISKWIPCPAAVDDIAQDVFIAAYQNLERFDGYGSLKSWLIGIAKNKIKQHLRAEARRRKHELNPLECEIQKWKVQQIDEELRIGESNEHILLAKCIEQLAPAGKLLIEEHYFKERTIESIACESNRTGGSLRMMLLRIRKALAKCIRNQHQ